MVVNTKATGTTESNTATVSTARRMVQNEKDAGKKANAASGMTSYPTQIKHLRTNEKVVQNEDLINMKRKKIRHSYRNMEFD